MVDGEGRICHVKAYLMLNKPAGYECSQRPLHHPSVYIAAAGALARARRAGRGPARPDTTGLLLLSDDGQFIHAQTSPKRKVPKVYEVTTAEPVTLAQIEALRNGVQLDDEPAPLAAADRMGTGEHSMRLTLVQVSTIRSSAWWWPPGIT